MNEARVRPKYRWRLWKVAAVAIAAALLVGGGVMALAGKGKEQTKAAPSSPASAGSGSAVKSFGPMAAPGGATPESTGSPADAESDGIAWSPVLARGGISFFAAFALAFAFRSFLRLALIFVGVWVASIFLLSSLGWIDIHWSAIDGWFVGFTKNLGSQFKSVTTLVTGSLPSAGLSGLGLLAGFRRS